ncbi:hypothetical protein HanRHA438_Chr00c12g0849181 [Helianthus annuus]|nr:hypothetical protein HanIR_Chr13g0616931 [Helianthus annuus]KAJ0954601.1 hypothetical protein HanRHA438_Chr00c12g0849181 [Helianthus annuus]
MCQFPLLHCNHPLCVSRSIVSNGCQTFTPNFSLNKISGLVFNPGVSIKRNKSEIIFI